VTYTYVKPTKQKTDTKATPKPLNLYRTGVALAIEASIRDNTKPKDKVSIQQKSMELASILSKHFPKSELVSKLEIVEPGFIHFHLNQEKVNEKFKASDQNQKEQPKPQTATINEKQKHVLEATLYPVDYVEEVFQLYKKYQRTIHKEEEYKITPESYVGFLVQTPLIREMPTNNEGPTEGYGTFHMHYRLDGKLVAVAVLDLLPHSINAVYFFWDTDYPYLNLGIYSALKEIELAKNTPGINYYYLGWYIHTCRKMNYKATFKPSQLLCPDTYAYVYFSEGRKLLDENGYSRLAPSNVAEPIEPNEEDMENMLCSVDGNDVLRYADLFLFVQNLEPYQQEIKQYVHFVGLPIALRTITVLNRRRGR